MCCKNCCTYQGPHRAVVKGEIPDFTTIESFRSYRTTGLFDGLDLSDFHRNESDTSSDLYDQYAIERVFRRAVEKNLEGPFELFGCLFTKETAEQFADWIRMEADYARGAGW